MRERKPIDPALRQYLDQLAANAPNVEAMNTEERTRTVRASMERALASRESIPGLPNQVGTRDLEIEPGLPVRLYTPSGAATPLPIMVYLHGGGWVAGSIATHDPFCRLLSEAAGIILVSVEYRCAPEHLYPAAVDDTLTAYRWAAAHAAEIGGDPARLVIGGDSAGGNLAVVAANELCSAPRNEAPCAVLLMYPVTDHPSGNHPSYAENATGYGLGADGMRWYWQVYAPAASPDDPRLSPLRLEAQPKLPPTLLATAEYDVLRDEGLALGDKLAAAGTPLTHLHAPEMTHNFPVHPGTVARFPQSDETFNRIAAWLRETLETGA